MILQRFNLRNWRLIPVPTVALAILLVLEPLLVYWSVRLSGKVLLNLLLMICAWSILSLFVYLCSQVWYEKKSILNVFTGLAAVVLMVHLTLEFAHRGFDARNRIVASHIDVLESKLSLWADQITRSSRPDEEQSFGTFNLGPYAFDAFVRVRENGTFLARVYFSGTRWGYLFSSRGSLTAEEQSRLSIVKLSDQLYAFSHSQDE